MKKQYIALALSSLTPFLAVLSLSAQTISTQTSVSAQVNPFSHNRRAGNTAQMTGKMEWNEGRDDRREERSPFLARGVVSSKNGNIITATGSIGSGPKSFNMASTTIFTIDATSAKIFKNGATSTLDAIIVGDNLFVQGTVQGTNIIATIIHDAKIISDPMPRMNMMPTGNGQPVIGGTISAVNGSSITVTTKTNIVYTVDASSATFTQNGASSTLGALTAGEMVFVQGQVNGNAVIASTINASLAKNVIVGNGTPNMGRGMMRSFIGRILSIFGF